MRRDNVAFWILALFFAATLHAEAPPPLSEVKAVPELPTLTVPEPTPCGKPALLTAIVPEGEGLLLLGEGPFQAAPLRREQVTERGLSGFARLFLDIVNAKAEGIPAKTVWDSGPFAEARLRQLRTAEGCPLLRVEVLLRGEGSWEVVTDSKHLRLLRPAPGAGARPSPLPDLSVPAESLRFSASGSLSEVGEGSRLLSGNVQFGYARQTAHGLFRAFAAHYAPRLRGSGAPFGAVSVSGLPAGSFLLGGVAGDLQTTLGGGGGTFLSPTTLLLRGGAATLSRGNLRFALFAGRAEASTLARLPDATGVLPEIGQDRVRGAQVSFTVEPLRLDLGAGLLRNLPEEGRGWVNSYLSLRYRLDPDREGRLLLEGSGGGGWAATFEPRWSSPSLSLGGYYRYTAKDFRPPLGTSLFASLRHGYNLYGSARLGEEVTASLSLTQSKSFNLFDPEAVGTLSSSQTASLAWAPGTGFSAGLTASRSESRSDPGASVPTRSRSENAGLVLSGQRGFSSVSLRVLRETVRDDYRRSQDLTATRVDVEGRRTFGAETEGRLLLRLYDGKRPSGEPVNRYYEARAEGRRRLKGAGVATADLFLSETPPGPTLVRVRQEGIGAALDFGKGGLRTALRTSWFRQEVQGRPARNGFLVQLHLSGLFQRGSRPPAPPAESRALPLPFEAPETSLLVVSTFWDENGNGLRDAGEAPLQASVLLDGGLRPLSRQGEGRFTLPPGKHGVELEWAGPLLEGYLPDPKRAVSLEAGKSARLLFAVRPAGRLEGRLSFRGTLPFPAALGQVRLKAVVEGLPREAVTDETGFFSFGPLPEGIVRIVLDGTTLAEGVVPDGPTEQEVTIERTKTTRIAFLLRAATARERILQ